MRRRSSKIVIITGFGLILVLLCFISLLAWYNIYANNHSLDEIVTKQEKFDEIFTMRDVAHQRVLLLYIMSNTDDPFEKDDLYMQCLKHADVFMKARDRFRSHSEGETVDSDNVQSWDQVSVLVRQGAGAQNRAIELINNGQTEQAQRLIHDEVLFNQSHSMLDLKRHTSSASWISIPINMIIVKMKTITSTMEASMNVRELPHQMWRSVSMKATSP